MAKIPDTLFRDWKNGETITAQDYKKEHEIIKTANNDNDDRIRVLEGIALGQIRQFPNGTVFPSNPETGYVFYHTTDNLVYALDSEGQWQAFSPKAIVDAHLASQENPHSTTASQVGAYTKTESDSLFVKRQTSGAVFGKYDAYNGNAGFFIFPVVSWITELNASLFQQSGTSNIKFMKAGLYQVHVSMNRSDLAANHYWRLGWAINDNPSKMLTNEVIAGEYKWSQADGPNKSKVPLALTHIIRVAENDYINFNTNSSDGPRTYGDIKFSIIRVGD